MNRLDLSVMLICINRIPQAKTDLFYRFICRFDVCLRINLRLTDLRNFYPLIYIASMNDR